MIDKIVRISANEAKIVFTEGPAFSVYDSAGNAVQVALWLLSPTKLNSEQFAKALLTEGEDTVCLKVA